MTVSIKTLPFSASVLKNMDSVTVSQNNIEMINVFVDEAGGINRRPSFVYYGDGKCVAAGATSYSYNDMACRGIHYSAIDGQFYFFPEKIIKPATGNFYYYTRTPREDGEVAGTKIMYIDPPTEVKYPYSFTEDATYIFFACGGKIYYGAPSNTTQFGPLADADAPTSVSHIAMMDGYLLANELNSNRFHWAATGTPLVWNAEYASAAGDPDNVVALHVLNREIFLFGARSFEIWENDGETPFIRKPGGFYQIGCIAPWSVVKYGNAIYWLTAKKRFIKYENGVFKHISTPYDKFIDEMTVVSDCEGHVVVTKGRTFLLFSFPCGQETLVYDLNTELWFTWRFFDRVLDAVSGEMEGANKWKFFDVRASGYSEAKGVMLLSVGWYNTICRIVTDRYFDHFILNGYTKYASVKNYMRTGHVDHGTFAKKVSNKLTLRLKRGGYDPYFLYSLHLTSTSSATGYMQVRFRDDAMTWHQPITVSMGHVGDTACIRGMIGLGTYATRQWELSLSDDVACVYVDGQEEVEVL